MARPRRPSSFDPEGWPWTASGDLFIADIGNKRIREVNLSTGIITTVAGTGTAGYNGDGIQATAATLDVPTGVAVVLAAISSSPTPQRPHPRGQCAPAA